MNKHVQQSAVMEEHRKPGAGARHWLFWIFLNATVLIALLFSISQSVAGERAGEIVSVLGKAEVFREGHWHALKPGEQVAVGAILRIGAGSRAAVQLANGSQLKLNANSRLELKAVTPRTQGFLPASIPTVKNILRVLSGEVWIRNNGEPLEIQTMPATATIRGTELNLAVALDDSTSLAVLEGLVELSNPLGSVLVTANEQATAKLGEAPRKTVLLNPLDAVQWSLYYPGHFSFRDYPLTSLSLSRLQESAEALERLIASSPQDAEALIDLGEVKYDLGKRKEAQKVFEQAVRVAPKNGAARTGLGWVYLEGGDPEVALREFRQVKPTTSRTLAGKALALYQLDRFSEAEQATAEAKQRFPSSPLPHSQTALNALIRGEPERALQALDRALVLDPHNAVAQSLRSNIYLVQNRKQPALEAAEQAIEVNPTSPSAYLALSAVEQANFELESALKAARKAVALDPKNPQTRIQEARLLFGMGRTREAYTIAEEARRLPPKDSMIESTWGFLLLARGQVEEAITVFEEAIALDSTRGEPRLGMGLALFRRNRTEAAVNELRKAALLESQVSLYQSYLGKAFYEVKNDPLADKSLSRAEQIDPRDPTPFLYSAIRLQSINRPVEALKDLQKSIELNDKRAVYRSRLLLDEDLAARSASLARIYDDLGFDRLAQIEASKSLSLDRTNFSAHRFLADSFSSQPRHEAARVSELLQAQLLQPVNVAPVPQQFAETNLLIPQNAGPTRSALHEYSPLFLRNRVYANVSGIAGDNATLGDEISVAGVTDRFSYGLSQFHYQTDGFRKNNDITHDIYRLFGQAAVTPDVNLQAELRWRRTRQGDLGLRFEPPDEFSRAVRQNVEEETSRISARAALTPRSHLLFSISYIDRTEVDKSRASTSRGDFPQSLLRDSAGFDLQGQYMLKMEDVNVVAGLSSYDIQGDLRSLLHADPCPFPSCEQKVPSLHTKQSDAYVYADVDITETVLGTLGLSLSSFEEGPVEFDSFSPKLGLQWILTDEIRFRAAAAKTVKRALPVERTLEPTTLAGFNQFFDDFNGTRAEFMGVAVDADLHRNIHGGIELSRRNLKVPRDRLRRSNLELVGFEDQRESLARVYLDWTPASNWALGIGYRYEKFDREVLRKPELPSLVETETIPVSVRYSQPSGLFASLDVAYVSQKVELELEPASTATKDSERFLTVNSEVGYRLPKRRGTISLDVQNIFDQEFLYQDENIQTADPSEPRYIPERAVYVRFSLNF